MGLADRNELAPRGLVRLVIYPRTIPAASPAPVEPTWRELFGPERRTLSWLSIPLVFLSAAALTFASVYARELWSGRNSSPPRFLQTVFPPKGLGLNVQYEGERLLITWSRTSPSVRSAASGILRIDDGGGHRDVLLDAMQITDGSVLYKPASGDVTFRLEVESGQGKPAVESIRVLDSAQAPPLQAPAKEPGSNPLTKLKAAAPPAAERIPADALP